MNKDLMLQEMTTEFHECMNNMNKLKYLYASGKEMLKNDSSLTEENKRVLADEVNLIRAELEAAHGRLMCIGASCDNLRNEITYSAEVPEQGPH